MVVDYYMPEMNGHEVATEIRRLKLAPNAVVLDLRMPEMDGLAAGRG
jgi:CheY-like chemotaxis protein